MCKPKADLTTEDAAEQTEFGPSSEVASAKHRIDKILTGTLARIAGHVLRIRVDNYEKGDENSPESNRKASMSRVFS
jgi:hypothetical protein